MKTFVVLFILVLSSASWALVPIKVAFSLDKPPYVIRASESGLEVEILRRVFTDMGYDMTPIFQPPARSVRSLELGRVDAMATITNMPKFHLSAPYITFKNFAWTLKDRQIHLKALADLGRYRVIAFQNARFFFGSDFDKAVAKNLNYEEYADQKRQLRMLFADRVDVIICEERTLKINQKDIQSGDKKSLPELQRHSLFGESRYSVAFRDLKLRDSFNDSFEKLESQKAFLEIYKRYVTE
ncbi:transporter substrate-binding domain-containing protein [Bdellovibrio bacteriovorus]|uniref:substrate-binding periplasmic protein n=1 Tax=Bdellovibrio bacteriovorus TaxID=959 RepID=UPI0021D38C6F|nr:transporter substrate-binding domain-containing protein [Bdellovibrio bacteriovorus]UXR63505.1 transporter substrate-binding domain-containing protein [Bdellovibrio bacteriovorus]